MLARSGMTLLNNRRGILQRHQLQIMQPQGPTAGTSEINNKERIVIHYNCTTNA
jgi:hypothetical protein